MEYIKATGLLPENLIIELQKYVQGKYLYIPKQERKQWGEESGSRSAILERNREIRGKRELGESFESLSEQYFLSVDSIKKIVYSKTQT